MGQTELNITDQGTQKVLQRCFLILFQIVYIFHENKTILFQYKKVSSAWICLKYIIPNM